ncbi:transposase, partial [Candidatus Sumerlaeota bacterium]|nr:transposase [Candidatus Sumerlaeota bacterium]
MASHHTHPYNPAGVIAFFISFRCYGTWLHGDERGSMDRSQYHAFGTAPIASDPSRFAFERSLLRHPPMTLDAAMRRTVEKTIQEVCRHRGWHLHAVNAQKDHVHTVVTARDVTPERVLNDFKIWCTRRLREMPSLTLGLPHKRDTHETDGGDTRETDGGDTRETDGGDTRETDGG